ncbi:TetR/AcrR family transcriptional regulator [Pseudolysobacter antarcticus]|uniref:TetR/AcrR family transcriptional regulator n=1 Tax=Pseudolysobacter antarcticus TaxID=2511995 RepID=A0A411HJT8_9GAMM|nr:TetR/AcrR family transcriptional regulator [Pseudolysobacter antarcticus]QBB70796.1 TetR/AcrR family transcriptional regulator [Pseudolysobacter antarcticus]
MKKSSSVKHQSTPTSIAANARGRPRNVEARNAILTAARSMLEEGGIAAVTMEGIALRAGVGKPTIYRTWPNALAVAMAAMVEVPVQVSARRKTPSGVADLRRQLADIIAVFATRMGRNVAMVLAASNADTELSKVFRNHFILARRNEGRSFVERAIAQHEIRVDIDIEVVLDLIYAPVFYRLLVGHAALDSRFTDSVLAHVLAGIGTNPANIKRRITTP